MTTYPTTAKLAAFRRRIADQSRYPGDGYQPITSRDRVLGIGHRSGCGLSVCDASRARTGAAEMRSRSYVLRWGTWEYKASVAREHPDVRVDDWTHWVSHDESTADHQAFQPRYSAWCACGHGTRHLAAGCEEV